MTYARLRAMGTNGFQEPAVGLEGDAQAAPATSTGAAPGAVIGGGKAINASRGKEVIQTEGPNPVVPTSGEQRIKGTKRLYADGKFNKPDGKAVFAVAAWRGLEAEGKQAEKDKYPFLINNGRTNHVWQSAYLDQANDFVTDRFPLPFIQIGSADMTELGLKSGDLVEVFNDNGSTQAMAWPTATARRKQAFMLFAHPTGVAGNVVSKATNELIIPNYKQTWAGIRKMADAPELVRHLSFKTQEYTVG